MIFSVEKRRSRRGGKLHETRSYYLRYRIGDMPVDRWKSLGVTDKQVADKKAHEFVQECERETAGTRRNKSTGLRADNPGETVKARALRAQMEAKELNRNAGEISGGGWDTRSDNGSPPQPTLFRLAIESPCGTQG